MNYNEICGFTSYSAVRKHRDFIKIMVKCTKILNNTRIQPNQFFFPNQPQNNKSNSGPERGKPEVSAHTSLSTHKISQERKTALVS